MNFKMAERCLNSAWFNVVCSSDGKYITTQTGHARYMLAIVLSTHRDRSNGEILYRSARVSGGGE